MASNPSPSALSQAPRIFAAIATLAAHFLALVTVLFMLCSVVPAHVNAIEYAGLERPEVTEQVIAASRFSNRYWHIIGLAAMIVDGAIVAALALGAWRHKWLLATYSHVLLLAAIFLILWMSITMAAPFFGLSNANGEPHVEDGQWENNNP